MSELHNLVGKTFERLTVVRRDGSNKSRSAVWLCICSCGNTTRVSSNALVKNRIKSCGCLQKEITSARATHRLTKSAIYRRWASMKARCNNPNTTNYEIYGGKGITYDPSWEDFINFYMDMKDTFEETLELDRIDVNKNYSKENCRWVTHNENNYNKTKQSNNSSGKTGVSFKKNVNKWFAYITVNGKQINLGLYQLFEDAVAARKTAELEYYGYGRP